MKLKEYAKQINKLVKNHPNADVVYSIDDEGNNYRDVYYHPTYGDFDRPEKVVCIN